MFISYIFQVRFDYESYQLQYAILEEISMVINGPMNHEIYYGRLKDSFLV
jgi:hypothetical protein